ncbi:hypothetical protein RintRC_0939 [Richelia intracellularis]|nr:hypothetical protein RintRC_0939 [Richelia intracellularis]
MIAETIVIALMITQSDFWKSFKNLMLTEKFLIHTILFIIYNHEKLQNVDTPFHD